MTERHLTRGQPPHPRQNPPQTPKREDLFEGLEMGQKGLSGYTRGTPDSLAARSAGPVEQPESSGNRSLRPSCGAGARTCVLAFGAQPSQDCGPGAGVVWSRALYSETSRYRLPMRGALLWVPEAGRSPHRLRLPVARGPPASGLLGDEKDRVAARSPYIGAVSAEQICAETSVAAYRMDFWSGRGFARPVLV